MVLLKFFHVFFVFLWIGSLVTLSGLFAHQKELSKELSRLLRKTYLSIDLPAMCLAVGLGVILLVTKTDLNWKAPWLHMKLMFAAFLIISDLVFARALLKGKLASWHKMLHCLIVLFLIGVLVAIYIMKPGLH